MLRQHSKLFHQGSKSGSRVITDRQGLLISVEIDLFVCGRFQAPVLLDQHHPNHPRAHNRAQRKSSRCAETDSIPRLIVVWPQVRAVDVSDLSFLLAYLQFAGTKQSYLASNIRHGENDLATLVSFASLDLLDKRNILLSSPSFD
jgi:hypothetical protein